MPTARRPNLAAAPDRLSLTDEFSLVFDGCDVALPHSVERLVAYLGLNQQPVHRMRVAGVLWPDAPGTHAARNLRTALWRLEQRTSSIVDHREGRLALAPQIRIDVAELFDLCRRLIDASPDDGVDEVAVLVDNAELLPDWDDDWVVADRERFRVLRLEALERAADRLIERAEYGRAMEAALSAAHSDPLRESARRLVIRVHVAEGNHASALQAYEDYRLLLEQEVGVAPSEAMQALVREFAAH